MLRTKITLVVVAAAALAMTLAAFLSYRGVSDVVAEQFDHALEDRAVTVVALLGASRTPPVRPDTTEQVLSAEGAVRPLDPGRPALPAPESALAVARGERSGAREDITVDGAEYGVLTVPLPGNSSGGGGGGGALMVAQHYAGAERIDHAFLWRVPWTTVAATALSALLSWLALDRILLPVRRLARVTRDITTTRDLTTAQDLATALPQAGRDEIGQLTRSFASMFDALRRSRAQQQRLVQDASHELRTPLTSVRGSAELLQRGRGRLAPEDEEQILTTLVTEAAALDTLVRELVDLATDRSTEEEPAEVDLTAEAEDAAHRHRQRTGRTVTVTARAPVPVRARPRAVRRCVDNLLSNALKFSPGDTPVTVHVEGARLSVRDHGPGIAPDERDAVFDRFYRGPRTQAVPGSGLGLAIVHDLVTADDGTVFATAAPDGGAEVGFRLPPHAPRARS
ncbi:HAMP domain-containing histidine kinase [Streptomyces sp. NBC_00536]|uniref:sensor histidine kinase n=1 Tax=Streptomyces sp. NBC_00536 TaxID=2975769 RepID=UPI002E7FEE93|nr:HAMP domain-containing sensor histidine kinase [Streptomyces sp. NBC_00536]WUC84020.1 HAMP domain-containing histidine kinase [Streptomyces sp. NBC_00536]